MTYTSSTIAIFDFDGTLVSGDSLLPFLAHIKGWPKVLGSLAEGVVKAQYPKAPDFRTAVKERLLMKNLAGVPLAQAQEAAENLTSWAKWKIPQLQALEQHRARGHHIVVATGGLEIYILPLLRELNVNAVLATKMEVVDGVLTGHMEGGNCVREEKARRVAAYMQEHGPFTDSWGYGNLPRDLPMLQLVKRRVVV